jgi:hypothetical protein
MLENGTDLRIIQALLGHTRIDTTARYAAVSPNTVAKAVSPLDRLGQPQANYFPAQNSVFRDARPGVRNSTNDENARRIARRASK